jgi:NADH dehydrogenase/NADH:ubiquinone oxidoreductase subunit G
MEFTIDGRKVSGKEGQTILQVAREHYIHIPTLCHNDGLSDYGACRVCLVELKYPTWSRLVTSCLYPVKEGLEVLTKSDWVLKTRRGVVELLLARCPEADAVKRLAAELGLTEPNARFVKNDKDEKCVLCGMCIRACEEVVGVSAIFFSGHGVTRKVCTPYDEANPVCIGCGSCAFVCPTDVIPFEDLGEIRKIWHREFQMRKCEKCGGHYIPKAQVEFMKKKLNIPDEFFNNCPDCR